MEKETKKCPFCGEEILATAIKCKHCGEFLEKKEEETKEVKEEKKGSIGKGILQFIIFFVFLGIGMIWGEKNILGIILFIVALFRYCFVSYSDKNPFFDKESFMENLKSKKRWMWFIIVGFLRGWMMLGSYQGKYSERIHDIQQATSDTMEQSLDDVEQGIDDTTDNIIQDLEEMK